MTRPVALVVSSTGGHLDEIMRTRAALSDFDVVLVVNDQCSIPDYPFKRVYQIVHAERDAKVLKNFAEAARILLHEKPAVLLSAGAGPVVPFAVLCKLFCSTRIVFVESAAAVSKATLTGKLMYPLAHRFFFQWPALSDVFSTGHYCPLVFARGSKDDESLEDTIGGTIS